MTKPDNQSILQCLCDLDNWEPDKETGHKSHAHRKDKTMPIKNVAYLIRFFFLASGSLIIALKFYATGIFLVGISLLPIRKEEVDKCP